MMRFKFNVLAVMLMLTAFSFSACSSDDNDDTYLPPNPAIVNALKQLYPGVQNVEWEQKGVYFVADCWLNGSELEVWFDANANWIMTEEELNSIDDLVPAVYTAFTTSEYSSWVVTDVALLTYPTTPTESVIDVKQGEQRFALYYTQDGGLVHKKDISNGDDTHWPDIQ